MYDRKNTFIKKLGIKDAALLVNLKSRTKLQIQLSRDRASGGSALSTVRMHNSNTNDAPQVGRFYALLKVWRIDFVSEDRDYESRGRGWRISASQLISSWREIQRSRFNPARTRS